MTKTQILTSTEIAPNSLAAAIASGPRQMDPVERLVRTVTMSQLRARMDEILAAS